MPLWVLGALASVAAFSTWSGGCPSHPSHYALPNPLPPPIASALKRASQAVELIARRGIPPSMTSHSTTLTPSVSIGVVYGQELIWTHGIGERDPIDAPGERPTADTIYRIGSISPSRVCSA